MPRTNARRTLTAAVVTGAIVLGAGLSGCGKTETTATLLADAKQYQQKGDVKAALIQLKNAVTKSPQDGEARLALGTFYADNGDMVSAEKELRKARELKIDDKRVLLPLGRASLALGQAKKVLEDVTPELAKNSAELTSLRGDAFLSLNDTVHAKEAYDQALALQPGRGDALVGQARIAASQKDLDGASRLVDEAVAKDPTNAEVFVARGSLLAGQGKLDEALAAFAQALKLNPQHRSAHIERANIEIGLKQFAEAKTDLDAASKQAPGSLMVLYTQAVLDFSQGKSAAARDTLLKVLRAAPDHLPSTLLAGAVELNLNANTQAEQYLRKYIESVPSNVYARKLLAQAQLKLGQPAQAVATLAPALTDGKVDAQLLLLAGQANLQVSNFPKAIEYLQQAVALEPTAAPVRAALGTARIGQGDVAKGIGDLEAAVTMDPKATATAASLVQAYGGTRQFDKALVVAQNLTKQQPAYAPGFNMLGAVYVSRGDVVNARAAFEKAVALDPKLFNAVNNLAQLDLREKKPDAARKRFETMLVADKKNYGALAALAEIAMRENKPAEATTLLEKAVAENGDALPPALTLGAHYLRTKQAEKAVTLLRKYQTANPANADLLDILGQAQVGAKDFPGALETFSKLVAVLPKSALAHVHLSVAHAAMKNDTEAAADLRRAVELQPDFAPARVAQAELAMRTGKTEEALAMARQVQKINDKNPLGFLLEGDMQSFLKKPALAQPAYEKAFALNKTAPMMVKLAEAMRLSGKTAAASALAAQWNKDHPADTMGAMYYAEQMMSAKQYKPASILFEDILKREPANPVVLNNLAWVYQQEKDPRALATAQQALKVSKDSPVVMDTVGWMMVEQGDTKGGLVLLQKAAALMPNAPDVHYHLAAALHKNGDKDGARKELTALLAQNKPFREIDEARALLKTL
ncbi:XrtA/PEP-CTERM system TPR-repeat protein PrsT [Massilia sp. S19_KUP03_FR1]|uniref:XrtA/PEP-CTERM system TPR-repeat protein PrsT n=1 Tax=Massilia sp. S19_KUP03_FR1 TaxID=3025503 RepID=UPI002FCD868F